MDELHGKYAHLLDHLRSLGSAAAAFSGGADSAFLLAAAKEALGDKVLAVTAVSPSLPKRELADAEALCRQLSVRLTVFQSDELELEEYRKNPQNRCYYCKHRLFSRVLEIAEENCLAHVIEGSNKDDEGDQRPGMQALAELGIISPLRECGFTKAEIRRLSQEMGLPTYDKPSAACLASRIPYGDEITAAKLGMAEQAEDMLSGLGLKQLRVRIHGDTARIEVLPEQFDTVMAHREEIVQKFRLIGFRYVSLDLQGYRTGSLNETINKEEI